MRRALTLATKGLGRTNPNPAVGAVVVREGHIIGEGYHQRAGTPHAEMHALNAAGEAAREGTLYVTLEPCNHTGRTPPCTHAVLTSGVRRVVIGTRDPNSRVKGGGCDVLRQAGLDVEIGCLEVACRHLIAPFAKHLHTSRPWVRAKVACSLDGRIATRTGHAHWITNEAARRYGHGLRDRVDAILVGRKTVETDDARLTCRPGRRRGRDPMRVVLDSTLNLPIESRILALDSSAPTVVVGVEGPVTPRRRIDLERAGAHVWLVPADQRGRVSLTALLTRLGAVGVQDLLVEGGATVHGAFWDAQLVDEALFFYAPLVIGGRDARGAVAGEGVSEVNQAPRLHDVEHHRLGDNWLVRGLVTNLDSFWRAPR